MTGGGRRPPRITIQSHPSFRDDIFQLHNHERARCLREQRRVPREIIPTYLIIYAA